MHEFLGPIRPSYHECNGCGKRKSLICTRCGLCFTCHPIAERGRVSVAA